MSLISVPGHKKAFVAIQKFFPGFQSERAGIVYAKISETITEPGQITPVLDLPFVHRIEIVHVGSIPFLVANTLCSGKTSRNDWSQSGVVYAGPIPENPSNKWSVEPILEGLSKDHGMHVANIDQRPVVMVSGKEGLFMLQIPEKPSSQEKMGT